MVRFLLFHLKLTWSKGWNELFWSKCVRCPASSLLSFYFYLHLNLLLPKHMTKFNQTLHKASMNPWWERSKDYSKDGPSHFSRGDNNKFKKMHSKTSPEPLVQLQPNQAQSIFMQKYLISFKRWATLFCMGR